MLNIQGNIKDLMLPFQKKWYVMRSMQGSYSIKYVMPALVPKMQAAYKKLDLIHNGSEAMNAFANLGMLKDDEKEKYRLALLEYCKLDTLSMVKILEVLKKTVNYSA